MLSKVVIGGLTLLALASSFLGTNLSFVKNTPSRSLSVEPFFSDLDKKSNELLTIYTQLTNSWRFYQEKRNNDWDPAILYKALNYTSEKQREQITNDEAKTPYILYSISIAKILWEEGLVRDVDLLAAALLYNGLKETNTKEFEIEELFGSKILSITKELSNSPILSSQENTQRELDLACSMSQNAKLIKLADYLYKIRDLKTTTSEKRSKKDVEYYFNSAQKLVEALNGTNEELEASLKWEISQPTSGKSAAISKSLALG